MAKKPRKPPSPSDPYRLPEEQAVAGIMRAAEALLTRYGELLKPHGVTWTQYNVLRILARAGEAGATCSEIADSLFTRDPDVTRVIDRLRLRGLVNRGRDLNDRRVVRVWLTAAGQEAVNSIEQPATEMARTLFDAFSHKKLNRLIDSLERLRADELSSQGDKPENDSR